METEQPIAMDPLPMDKVITTDAVDFVRALPDRCVDVVFTDSPYPNGMKYFEKDIKDAKFVLSHAWRISRDLVIFFWSPMYREEAPKPPSGWYLLSPSAWFKTDAGTKVEIEDVYVYARYVPGERRKWPKARGYVHDIMNFRNRRDFHNHPTQKPVDLLRDIIFEFTAEGATIFDPFGGTGSIGKAAKQARRHCLTLERDEHWATIARERIEKTTAWPSWRRYDPVDESDVDVEGESERVVPDVKPEPIPAAPMPVVAREPAKIPPAAKLGAARLASPVKGKK